MLSGVSVIVSCEGFGARGNNRGVLYRTALPTERELESSIFGSLNALRARPIPDQTQARANKAGARALPIARGARQGNEPLVDLTALGIAGENYYHAPRNPPYWRRIDGSIAQLLARRGVAEKLASINARLAAFDLELFVFDAWRPRAVQRYFHDVWMPAELTARDPALERRRAGARGRNLLGRAD